MAKGLINESTLTAIADSIRAQTGTADGILPADMPAMIRGIGRPIYTGFIGGTGETSATYSLGASLPVYENYSFLLVPADFSDDEIVCYYCGYKMVVGNMSVDYLRTQTSILHDSWNIDFENGTIQHQYFSPGANEVYKWCYFEELLS